MVLMDFTERNPLSVSSLSIAVERNAVKALRRLIQKGRNTNITDNRGWTPLHEAAALGHLACLTILLEAGSRVDVITHKGETPFLIACKYNRMEIVDKLLDWDETLIHTSNNESVTPLHIACADHNLPLIEYLLENDANINAEDNSGLTPLQEAVMREDIEICKLLIENGANLDSREYDGHLAFHFACMTGTLEILKLLVSNYEGNIDSIINSGNCYGFTPLMLAVQCRSVHVIEELLRLGADANVVNKSDHIALHLASHTGDIDIVKSIFKVTSTEAVNKYCTLPTSVLNDLARKQSGSKSMETSIVSLVIDSESMECLDFILNCGFTRDVLNCPIIQSLIMPIFYDTMHCLAEYGPHKNIEIEVNISDLGIHEIQRYRIILLHPIGFLLKDKMLQLGKETVQYLKLMLENGLTFDYDGFCTRDVTVLHPYEAMLFNAKTICTDNEWKGIVVECLCLMIEHGISVDFDVGVNSDTIPVLFVYACRLPLLEIIPHLVRNSNLVDVDDLLRWVVHKIFMRIDPPPHMIEKSLLDSYKYLTKYTSKSVYHFVNEIRRPEYESRFSYVFPFIDDTCSSCIPSLQIMCRSVIRKSVKDSCRQCPHQLKIRLNSLELPASLLSYLNYNDMLESSI